MDRGLDRDDDPREPAPKAASIPTDPRDRAVSRPAPRPFSLPTDRRREPVQVRDRTYHLRDTEARTLEVTGTFRAVFTRDLEVGVYAGDRARLARDLEALAGAGLIQRRPFTRGGRGQKLDAVSLTRDGEALLEASRTIDDQRSGEPRQAVYAGFVRPTELLHDATLYRLFLDERDRLEREGSVVTRVVLDHELKAELYRAAHVDGRAAAADRQAHLVAAAAALHLPVVDGHVQFPDLRLEVEDAAGSRTRVDLELATEAYRAGQLRAKARAGFAIYRAVGIGGGTSRLAVGGTSGGHAAGAGRDLASALLSL